MTPIGSWCIPVLDELLLCCCCYCCCCCLWVVGVGWWELVEGGDGSDGGRCQKARSPGDFRKPQEASGYPRKPQDASGSGSSRRPQEAPGMLQKAPGCSRMLQEACKSKICDRGSKK